MSEFTTPALVPDGFDTSGWDGKTLAYIPGTELKVDDSLKLHRLDCELEIDPITLGVIRHSLWNATLEHGSTMEKLAVSPITLETRDFQVTILTELGEPIFYGPYLQYFSGWTDVNIRYLLEFRSAKPGIRPGDMFLHNDPWVGTGHQNDVSLLAPVFWQGELFCWVATCAHQTDVGGSVPGGFVQTASDVFQEPVPLPPFKIIDGGEMDPQMEDLYRRHSRLPVDLSLDLRAAIAGNNQSERRIIRLIEKYGPDVVKATMNQVLDSGSAALRKKLESIPDGKWRERVFMERAVTGDRGTYKVELELEKRGDELIFRNAGTDPQAGCLNITFGPWRGGCITPFSSLLLPELMGSIGGVIRHLRFEPQEGTMTCPTFGAGVSMSGIYGAHVVVSMGQSVMCKMLLSSSDEELRRSVVTPTAAHIPFNAVAGTNDDGEFVIGPMLDCVLGCTGATPFRDGREGDGFIGSPTTQAPNVEAHERVLPLLILYRKVETDSAGAGKRNGGSGGKIAYVPHKGNLDLVNFIVYGVPKTHGLMGGLPGSPCDTVVLRGADVRAAFTDGRIPMDLDGLGGEELVDLIDKDPPTGLGANDVVEWNWVSTGGFGDPIERALDEVGEDVKSGRFSRARAAEVFGAVVAADGEIDGAASEAARQEIRQARLAKAEPGRIDTRDLPDRRGVDGAVRIGDAVILDSHGHRCANCDHALGPAGDNFKEYLALETGPLETAGTGFGKAGMYVELDDIELRRLYCPGCAAMLAIDVSRKDDPILNEYEVVLGE